MKALGLRVKACDCSPARNREAFVGPTEPASGSPEAGRGGGGGPCTGRDGNGNSGGGKREKRGVRWGC